METKLVVGSEHISKQDQGHREQRPERVAGPKATQRAPRRSLGIIRGMVGVQSKEDPWIWRLWGRNRVAVGSGPTSDKSLSFSRGRVGEPSHYPSRLPGRLTRKKEK